MNPDNLLLVYLGEMLSYFELQQDICEEKGDKVGAYALYERLLTLCELYDNVAPSVMLHDLSDPRPLCGRCRTEYEMYVKDCQCMGNVPMYLKVG